MKKVMVLFLVVLLVGLPNEIEASSGKLRSASIVSCNGKIYGQHSSDNHWHVASKSGTSYYATGSAIYSNPCSSNSNSGSSSNSSSGSSTNNIETVVESKSDDNTIEKLVIDNEVIEVSNSMSFETEMNEVKIEVTLNDQSASYDIDTQPLTVGSNIREIKVTSESGITKVYSIDIIKIEKEKNFGLTLYVEGQKINFIDGNAKIEVSSDVEELKYTHYLEDENAELIVIGDKKINFGSNSFEFKVVIDEIDEVSYFLVVDKVEESVDYSVFIIVYFSTIIFVGIGFVCYYILNGKIKLK